MSHVECAFLLSLWIVLAIFLWRSNESRSVSCRIFDAVRALLWPTLPLVWMFFLSVTACLAVFGPRCQYQRWQTWQDRVCPPVTEQELTWW